MSRFLLVAESSIIPVPSRADAVAVSREQSPSLPSQKPRGRLTFTGIIGAVCWFPLNAIITAVREAPDSSEHPHARRGAHQRRAPESLWPHGASSSPAS